MRRFCSTLLPFLVVGLVLAGCDGGGTVPDDVGDDTAVSFTTAGEVVGEADGTVTLDLEITDPGHTEFEIDVSVNTSQSTATLGEDVTGLPADTTITFPSSATSGSTQSLSFDVVDDDVFLEGDETVVVTLSAPDTAGVDLGQPGTFELTIEDDDDAHTAQEARTLETGSRAVVEGIATRTDADGVYLQDETGALYVFSSDFASTVNQGDSIRVDGTTTYFSGLFQIEGVSDNELTTVLSSGHTLPSPEVVSVSEVVNNGEEYESELIRVENFSFDGSGTFEGETAYTINAGATSSTLFVPGGSGLVGEDIPERAHFQGVLGQFNNFGAPDDDTGYQLLGLLISDLEPLEALVTATFSDDTLAPMTAFSVASNADWGTGSEGDAPHVPYAVANGFGADEASNDWLISPAMNFNNYENEVLTFLNAKGFNDSGRRGLQVKVSTDYSGSGDPTNATWTDVSDHVTFSGGDFNFVGSGSVDLSAPDFQGASVYVAFQYQSTSPDDAATWQVDNVSVAGQASN